MTLSIADSHDKCVCSWVGGVGGVLEGCWRGGGYIIQILLPHICTWGRLGHTGRQIFMTSLHRVIEFSTV